MATVYRALDTMLDRVVALKVINQRLRTEDEAYRRFLNEAKGTAALVHPNIVTVYELGIEEGNPFIAMEFVPGHDLRERMEQAPPLSLRQKLEIAGQVARALRHAHAHGVIHRDVKPANIRIQPSGAVRLIDFGVARFTEKLQQGLTKVGALMGTSLYMSPEQARGETNIGPASDIFSFGILLYEMLAGRRPFQADSMTAFIFKVLYEEPAELDASLPAPLRELIRHCLQKPVAQRLQSFEPIVLALDELLQRPGLTGALPKLPPPEEEPPIVFEEESGARLRQIVVVVASLVSLGISALVITMSLGWLSVPPPAPQARPSPTPEATLPPEAPATATPARATPAKATSTPTHPPTPSPRPRHATPSPAPPKAVGRLSLTVQPWAFVRIDDFPETQTPLTNVALPVGRHWLYLSKPGHEQLVQPFEIKEGETLTLSLKLNPK